MATMKDIAKLSGVSRGTVDRVLNHRGIVSPDTRKKVLEIAKLLDYHPNRAGIALAAQKKKLKTGVLLSGPGNPFFDEVMDGLNHRLASPSTAAPSWKSAFRSIRPCSWRQWTNFCARTFTA